jgi:hypothetical protein
MAVTKKTRFEVFKRDKFTCQYCGRTAPDVTLQADHIDPKAKGGKDDLLNLITSCEDCNQGQSDRILSDDSALKKRKRQLDQLQERREQLEMMMEWHKSLIDLEEQTVTELSDFWGQLAPGYHLNEAGLENLKRWVKRFGINEVIEAMKISTAQYLEYDPKAEDPTIPTHSSVEKTWKYIPRICTARKKQEGKPYLKDLYYIRGILRNRLSYVNDWQSIQLMEEAITNGIEIEQIKDLAKKTPNWSSFKATLEDWRDNGLPD